MEQTDLSPCVSDAGPLIHLDELDSLDLLNELGTILVPETVWLEVSRHRPGLRPEYIPNTVLVDVIAAGSPEFLALADSLALDAGERTALQLLQERKGRLFLCDDTAARLAAESLGFAVHGTIGVLLRSLRTGRRTRSQLLSVLRELPQRSTLHLAKSLVSAVIESVEQSSAG
jgi:predicted nucleic acid-binding protein